MAHIGKIWKLLFRRDVNLNVVTNQLGWANRYLLACQFPFNGGPGTLLENVVFDCGPGVVSFPDTITWPSQVEHILIFDFSCRLEAEISNTEFPYAKRLYISEAHIGVILIMRFAPFPTGLSSFPPAFGNTIEFFDTDFWDRQPLPPVCRPTPKLWIDGAPQ